jgi:hypothetical protein
VVRRSAEQLLDPGGFRVGEPEGAVERLLGDLGRRQVVESSRPRGRWKLPDSQAANVERTP